MSLTQDFKFMEEDTREGQEVVKAGNALMSTQREHLLNKLILCHGSLSFPCSGSVPSLLRLWFAVLSLRLSNRDSCRGTLQPVQLNNILIKDVIFML